MFKTLDEKSRLQEIWQAADSVTVTRAIGNAQPEMAFLQQNSSTYQFALWCRAN